VKFGGVLGLLLLSTDLLPLTDAHPGVDTSTLDHQPCSLPGHTEVLADLCEGEVLLDPQSRCFLEALLALESECTR
jgi:hypothetical protein